MKDVYGRILVCSISMLMLILLVSTPSFSAEKVISLRFAHFMPTTSDQVVLAKEWASEVEKRTGGRVKVTVYPGSTLMPVA